MSAAQLEALQACFGHVEEAALSTVWDVVNRGPGPEGNEDEPDPAETEPEFRVGDSAPFLRDLAYLLLQPKDLNKDGIDDTLLRSTLGSDLLSWFEQKGGGAALQDSVSGSKPASVQSHEKFFVTLLHAAAKEEEEREILARKKAEAEKQLKELKRREAMAAVGSVASVLDAHKMVTAEEQQQQVLADYRKQLELAEAVVVAGEPGGQQGPPGGPDAVSLAAVAGLANAASSGASLLSQAVEQQQLELESHQQASGLDRMARNIGQRRDAHREEVTRKGKGKKDGFGAGVGAGPVLRREEYMGERRHVGRKFCPVRFLQSSYNTPFTHKIRRACMMCM